MATSLCWWCIFKYFATLSGAFLLGLLLGTWLYKSYKSQVEDLRLNGDSLQAKLDDLQKDAAGLRYQISEMQDQEARLNLLLEQCKTEKNALVSRLNEQEAALADARRQTTVVPPDGANMDSQSPTTATKVPSDYAMDDLTVIKGIDDDVSQLLKANGIQDWEDLAQAEFNKLKQILQAAGSSFTTVTPDSWSKQAELAAQRKWRELEIFQSKLI